MLYMFNGSKVNITNYFMQCMYTIENNELYYTLHTIVLYKSFRNCKRHWKLNFVLRFYLEKIILCEGGGGQNYIVLNKISI